MPAPRVYPTVPEQVRSGLADCRARGLVFAEAWAATVGHRRQRGTVVFPHLTRERRAWREALEATRGEWQAAYDRLPTTAAAAFEHVAGLLAIEADGSGFASQPTVGVVRLVHVPPPASIARHPRYEPKAAA